MPNPAFKASAGTQGTAGTTTDDHTSENPDPTTAGPTLDTDSDGTDPTDPTDATDATDPTNPTDGTDATDATDPTDATDGTEATTDESASDTDQPCDGFQYVDLKLGGDTFFLNESPDQFPLCGADNCQELNFGMTADQAFVAFEQHLGLFAMRWEAPAEVPETALVSARLSVHFSTMGGQLPVEIELNIHEMPGGADWWDIGTLDGEGAQVGDSNYLCRKIDSGGCIDWHDDLLENTPLSGVKLWTTAMLPAQEVLEPETPIEVELPLADVEQWLIEKYPSLDLLVAPATTIEPGVLRLFASETFEAEPHLELSFECP